MEDIQLRKFPSQVLMRLAQATFQVLFLLIAARFLTPAEFGVIAIIGSVLTFGNMVGDLGFEGAIIQAKATTHDQLSTSFWILTGIAVFISVCLILISPSLESFFKMPLLGTSLTVSTMSFPFSIVGSVPRSILLRDHKFTTIASLETVTALVAFSVGLTLLLLRQGVWGYISYILVLSTCRFLALLCASGWLPAVLFNWRSVRSTWKVGKDIQISGFLNYVVKNIDNFIVGRFVGATALGFYSLSYRIIYVQQDIVFGAMRQLVLPIYSSKRDDPQALYELLCRDTMAILMLSLPILTLACVGANWIIPTVFGATWVAAVPVFTIFCAEAARQSLFGLVTVALVACKQSDLVRRYAIVSMPILVLTFLVGARWGILGVAISFFLVNSILNLYLISLLRRGIQRSIVPFILQWLPGLLISLGVALVYYLLLFLFSWVTGIWRFLFSALIALLSSFWLSKLFFPDAWTIVKKMMLSPRRLKQSM